VKAPHTPTFPGDKRGLHVCSLGRQIGSRRDQQWLATPGWSRIDFGSRTRTHDLRFAHWRKEVHVAFRLRRLTTGIGRLRSGTSFAFSCAACSSGFEYEIGARWLPAEDWRVKALLPQRNNSPLRKPSFEGRHYGWQNLLAN